MAYFTEERLAKIPSDPLEGLRYICLILEEFSETESDASRGHEDRDIAVEFHSIITAFIEAHELPYTFDALPDDPNSVVLLTCQQGAFLRKELERGVTERLGRTLRARFTAHFSAVEGFTLTEGDIQEINDLVAQLRTAITASENLQPPHKQRVLRKLESLQSEIHKKVSDFDRLTGAVFEVLVVAKKVGEAGEPWVRMAKGLLEIVWRSQAQSFGLPSSAQMYLLSNDKKV